MLKVLVYGCLLGRLVLLEHGAHAALRRGRLAVHGLVELGIASVVLLFESNGRHVERRITVKDPLWLNNWAKRSVEGAYKRRSREHRDVNPRR
jgi:hypothetical protein